MMKNISKSGQITIGASTACHTSLEKEGRKEGCFLILLYEKAPWETKKKLHFKMSRWCAVPSKQSVGCGRGESLRILRHNALCIQRGKGEKGAVRHSFLPATEEELEMVKAAQFQAQ